MGTLSYKEYLTPIKLPKKLLSGRTLPDAPSYSPIYREWHEEQLEYILNGITIDGKFWNPFIYHFLNFFYFPVQRKNKKTGKSYITADPNYALFSRIDEYVFDKMWEAVNSEQHIALMGTRGCGKTFWALSLAQRKYNFFPNSHSIISASIQEHVDTAWDYMEMCLNWFDQKHPAFKHKRILNNTSAKKSGEIVKTSSGDVSRGYNSRITKVLYGRNPNKTRSQRPDFQIIEEFGAFPSKGLGNLKDVLSQSRGSNQVGGGIMKNFVVMNGTGGSVSNDHAKEVFHNGAAYDFMVINEWEGRDSGIFIPVQLKRSDTWEETGVPDIDLALKLENNKREKIKSTNDPVAYQNYCQEYPQTLREVFLKKGTNRFNQIKITSQLYIIEDYKFDSQYKVKRGSFRYKKNQLDVIDGVYFVHDGIGPINMIEEVELSKDGKHYNDLYVMGVDSIDIGTNESADPTKGSKLAGLVKKRIIDGQSMEFNNNMYVCWYNERSPEVNDDYEQILMMALYYKAKINLEFTRINIVSYFTMKGFRYLFMKRPSVASGGNMEKRSSLIGTQVNDILIDHQDSKIMDYVNDFHDKIFIPPLLEQLRDYQREDRTPYDLVVAMGLCEIADEEYIGKGAKLEQEPVSKGMRKIGFVRDKDGRKVRRAIDNDNKNLIPEHSGFVTWIDNTGTARFESEYLDSLKMEFEDNF